MSHTNVGYNNVSCTNANYTYDQLYELASEYAWETVGNSLEWDSVQEQRLEYLCEKYLCKKYLCEKYGVEE